jgi:transcriptional regulator with XRE-family HTH domain
MTSEESQSLGAMVRDLREEIGMSQAQLASQAELSQGYLSQIENDEVQNPSAAILFRLAQSLHVDPRILLEAAGCGDLLGSVKPNSGGNGSLDPDLLRHVAGMSLEQQRYLLALLEAFEGKGQPA